MGVRCGTHMSQSIAFNDYTGISVLHVNEFLRHIESVTVERSITHKRRKKK